MSIHIRARRQRSIAIHREVGDGGTTEEEKLLLLEEACGLDVHGRIRAIGLGLDVSGLESKEAVHHGL